MTTRNSAAAMAGACLACLLAGCTSMGGTSGDDNLTDGLDKDQAVFFSSAGGENCASKSVWGALVGGIAGAVIGSSQDSKGALVGALVGAGVGAAGACVYGLVENYQYDKDRANASNHEAHLKAEIAQVDAENQALANMTSKLKTELAANRAEIKRLKNDLKKGTVSRDAAKTKLAAMKKETDGYRKTLAEAKKHQEIYIRDSANARNNGFTTQADELDAKVALSQKKVKSLENQIRIMEEEQEALKV